ncbi:hypothetical protein B0H11DRAFT_1989128 [Mycena galericulata]|nr:hypothetical protein B0H11DRAFT_1989128 [Mycena galericulata]
MESPFTARLHTNFVPSDEEAEGIRIDLAFRLEELERIDERIRELSAERDKMKQYIDSHKALISHPRRLPADIVREIFTACLPADRNAVLSAQEAPLILCRICSAWRNIALTTPTLWASLHIPIDFILAEEGVRMPAVAQWLQLSGACPVSLSVGTVGEDPWMTPLRPLQGITALWDLLGTSSTRWYNIEISPSVDAAALLVLANPDVQTPILESLGITAEVSVLRQVNLFRVPSLRAVRLHSQGPELLDEFLLDLPFFWDRLTHISLDSTGPASPSQGLSLCRVLTLLRRCPQLVSFGFRVSATDDWVDSNSAPVSLPCLTSFIMFEPRILEALVVARLLEHLSMPELRRLDIPVLDTRAFDGHILSSIATTALHLESLSIDMGSFTNDSFLETFRCLSNLTKITTSFPPWFYNPTFAGIGAEHLLDLLTPDPEQRPITVCPRLQELEIKACPKFLAKEIVVDFIQRRMDFAHGFRRLEIIFVPPWPEFMSHGELQSFRARGLELSLPVVDDPWSRLTAQSNPWTGLSPAVPTELSLPWA